MDIRAVEEGSVKGIKDDSFGDGLTLTGRPRRLRVDFRADTESDCHYIAAVQLRQLSPVQRRRLSKVIDLVLKVDHRMRVREMTAAMLALQLAEHVKAGRVTKDEIVAALQTD